MRRVLAVLTLTVLGSTLALAGYVTPDSARRQAASFVAGRMAKARGARLVTTPTLRETRRAFRHLYVFNVGQDEGFVIVSDDDQAASILGYADSGTFDETQLPDNARVWLAAYGEEIDALPLQPSPYPRTPPPPYPPLVRPFLPTLWGQREPYNLLCPEGTPTGCVATALAQVMYYYQWPQAETTVIPGYGSYEGLPPTTFSWDRMLAGYGGDEPAEQQEAVAQLMQYCGWAVQMSYGKSMSTAYNRLVPIALTRYFGYDAGVCKVERSDYSPLQWDSLIYCEIEQGRPVILGGQKSGSAGHEFVCDGYDGEGLYHINWGWSGISDGFFRLSALNPPQVGTGGGSALGGYSLRQTAIIGIQPDTGSIVEPVATDSRLTVEDLRVMGPVQLIRSDSKANFTASLRCWIANHTTDTLYLKCGMALTDEDGQLVKGTKVKQMSAASYPPSSYQHPTAATDYSFGSGLTGRYLISVYSSAGRSGTNWQPAIGSDLHFIEVEMTETTATLTERPVRRLAVDSISYAVTPTGLQLTASVVNRGEQYQGELVLMVNTSTSRPSYSSKAKAGVYLEPDGRAMVDLSYKPTSDALQQYRIGYTERDTVWLAEGEIYYKAVAVDPTAYTAYTPDGQKLTLHTDNDGRALIPDSVVAVNLTATTALRTLIPNNNPNTLYYLNETHPRPLRGGEKEEPLIISSNYADSIVLHDGYAFYCPVTFTAGHIAYVRTFDRGYDGKGGGWQTIVLPFDVQEVSVGSDASDDRLDWFRSPEDTGKQFWLMDFAGSTPDSLAFRHTKTFEANHPYLIAVPGSDFAECSHVGRPIVFTARSAVVRTTSLTTEHRDSYTLCGTYAPLVLPQSFMLNDTGTTFVHSAQPVMPFRAYMSE